MSESLSPNKNNPPENKAQGDSDNKDAVTHQLSPPVNVIVTGELQLKGADKQETGHEHFLVGPEWGLVVVTGVLVYVTARLVSFTKGLWSATVRLAEDAKATSDRQAADTQDMLADARSATNAAFVSAEAARTSANAASDNVATLIAAERAYIFAEVRLEVFENSIGPGKVFGTTTAIVSFWNYGKTVAAVTMIRGYPVVSDGVPHELGAFTPDSEKPLPPSLGIGSNCSYQLPLDYVMSLEDFPDIKHRNKRLFFVGKMEYHTILNKECVTGFCWELVYKDIGSTLMMTRDSQLNKRT